MVCEALQKSVEGVIWMKLLDLRNAVDATEYALNKAKENYLGEQKRVARLEECNSKPNSKYTSDDLKKCLAKAKKDLANATYAYRNIVKEYFYLRSSFEEDLVEVLDVPMSYRGKSVCVVINKDNDWIHIYFGYDDVNSAEHYIGHYSVNLVTCIVICEVPGLFAEDGRTPLGRVRFLADGGDDNDAIPLDDSIEVIDTANNDYADYSYEERMSDYFAGKDDDPEN